MSYFKSRSILFLLVAAFCCESFPASAPAAASTDDTDPTPKLSQIEGKWPQANIIFVEKLRQISYEADGAYVDRTYNLIKVLTEPAAQYFANLPVCEYYSYRSNAKLVFARVIKPDGTITDVPADLISDVANPMYRRRNVNDETMRLKIIAFKGLKPGDAVEYAVEETCTRPVSPDFELKEGKYLQEDEPTVHLRVEINGPDGKPLNHTLKCAEGLAVSFTTKQQNRRTSYIWEARDIAPFQNEPGWNTRQHFAARILASTIKSWADVSRTGYQINKASMDEDDNLRAVVKEATSGFETDEEKIRSLVRFLRKNIEYKGATSVNAYQGKPATKTLADRFGVCRDVAVLLCAMLKVAGIEGYPAATGYGRVFDPEIPHDIFQHMIVAVPDRKAGYRLYDPTAVLPPANGLPGYAGEAPLLVFRPEGEDLTRIPHIPALENRGRIQARSEIDVDGRLESTVTISGRGVYDEDLRNWRQRSKPEDYQKRWGELVTQVSPAAKITEVTTSEPNDVDTPFEVTIRYEASDYMVPGAGTPTIKAPLASDCFERVLTDIVARAKKPERKHPYILTTTVSVTQEETLLLPPGYTVKSDPEPTSVGTNEAALSVEYGSAPAKGTAAGIQVNFSKKFSIDSRQFDPSGYLELRKVLEANASSKNGLITLSKDK